MNRLDYTPLDKEAVLEKLMDDFFPQALRYTNYPQHDKIVDSMLRYFYTPFAEFIDYFQNELKISVLDEKALQSIESAILEELDPKYKPFSAILTEISQNVYNPNIEAENYWVTQPIFLFQSLLDRLDPDDYYVEPDKIQSWLDEYILNNEQDLLIEEATCEELAELLERIYEEDFYTPYKINEEFMTSGDDENENFIYNLTMGWDDFFSPVFTEEPDTTTEGVYDEIR